MVYIISEYLIATLYIMYKLLSTCISKLNDTGTTLYIYACMYIDKLYMWFKRDKKLWMDDLMGCFLWQELREIAAHHKENDTFPANWGKQPYNTKKNRYRDIVPCEWNRKWIMHIYVTTMHVYMCNDYHIYYDQFSGCPISSHGSWAYFLLI